LQQLKYIESEKEFRLEPTRKTEFHFSIDLSKLQIFDTIDVSIMSHGQLKLFKGFNVANEEHHKWDKVPDAFHFPCCKNFN
jgi:hypothetical protein